MTTTYWEQELQHAAREYGRVTTKLPSDWRAEEVNEAWQRLVRASKGIAKERTPKVETLRERVIAFHEAFCPEQGTGEGPPRIPPHETLKLRLMLIAEEFEELLSACGLISSYHFESVLPKLDRVQFNYISPAALPLIADALADLDYVVEGTRLAFGLDGAPIAAEVHRSNMAKVGGSRREDVKCLKPEGWTPPDIAGELKKQGWEG